MTYIWRPFSPWVMALLLKRLKGVWFTTCFFSNQTGKLEQRFAASVTLEWRLFDVRYLKGVWLTSCNLKTLKKDLKTVLKTSRACWGIKFFIIISCAICAMYHLQWSKIDFLHSCNRFSTRKKSCFPSYFYKLFKVKWLHNQFFAKEVALATIFSTKMIFSRNSVDFTFSFWLYSSEQKRGIRGKFSINTRNFYHT